MQQLASDTEFIVANKFGEEFGYAREDIEMDMDLGDTNDFELSINTDEWDKEKYWFGNRIFIPNTEYGGLIEDVNVITSNKTIKLRGYTWRGLLTQKVVEPPSGSDHLILSGELNSILRELIGERFGALFVVPDIDSGIEAKNWQVDRYVTLYDAITKLLESKSCRLKIEYHEPHDNEYGYVTIQVAPVVDYSDELEYSQDSRVDFQVRDYRRGINHLICAGTGQNEERIVLHLYVQEDGSIGKSQYYFGLDERAAVYDFSNADAEKLEEDGIKRLRELQNYKSIEVAVDDIDLEIGDIIGGYESITGTELKKPVAGKILKIQDGKTIIEYEVRGDE